MTAAPQLSIVIPCWNEAANLPGLIAAWADLWRDGDAWELLLVDNGSTDGTADLLAAARSQHPFLRVVTVPPPNIGYGHGILTGLRAARGDVLAWTHADGQTPPADVLRAWQAWQSSPQPERTIVKGRRRNRPLADAAFTAGMSVWATALLGTPLHDINAQPKLLPRALFQQFVEPPEDLSLDVYLLWLARQLGYRIATIDVRFGARSHGQSRWATSASARARAIRRTIGLLWNLRVKGSSRTN